MTQLSARIYITVFVAFIAAGCVDQEVETAGGTGDVPLSAEQVAEQTITADLMRDYVRELSDDKYEGRGPGSRGDRSARQYLVTEMEKLGLEPAAADGSWEQTFSLVGLTVDRRLGLGDVSDAERDKAVLQPRHLALAGSAHLPWWFPMTRIPLALTKRRGAGERLCAPDSSQD